MGDEEEVAELAVLRRDIDQYVEDLQVIDRQLRPCWDHERAAKASIATAPYMQGTVKEIDSVMWVGGTADGLKGNGCEGGSIKVRRLVLVQDRSAWAVRRNAYELLSELLHCECLALKREERCGECWPALKHERRRIMDDLAAAKRVIKYILEKRAKKKP